MWIFTFSGGRPNIAARVAWSTVWNCSPFHTSRPSAVRWTTQFIGSIAAWAR
jgi:hypothetical protein